MWPIHTILIADADVACDNEENMLKGMQPYLHRALVL
jgi:hypothetical protein